MPQEMTVRRKHLVYAMKSAPARAIRAEHIKDQKRVRRAKRVVFLDDADGQTHVLKNEV